MIIPCFYAKKAGFSQNGPFLFKKQKDMPVCTGGKMPKSVLFLNARPPDICIRKEKAIINNPLIFILVDYAK